MLLGETLISASIPPTPQPPLPQSQPQVHSTEADHLTSSTKSSSDVDERDVVWQNLSMPATSESTYHSVITHLMFSGCFALPGIELSTKDTKIC